ncbi:MAG: EFR1 family ferrodoxin [Bacteroidota bacterium]
MQIELRYFTGTGNSLKILNTCHRVFRGSGHVSNISEISNNETILPESDLLGFCFPVYAFGIPRISKKYLQGLAKFKENQKVFILITAGDLNESGYSIRECARILRRKNCDIVYSDVIQMPINWTTSPKPPFPPAREEAIDIINKGVIKTKEIARDILSRSKKLHRFSYPKRYSRIKFYWEYLLFKYMGINNLWRLFNVYDTCNGCKLCAKICPTNSIRIIDKKPVWSKSCEQCMRCVNFCPKESIYQTQGGDTRGKNRYFEPEFRP